MWDVEVHPPDYSPEHGVTRLFFSAGEPSGDLHAATLLQEIRRLAPDVLAMGYGGPKLAQAGCHLFADLTEHAVMWFGRVVSQLPQFIRLLHRAGKVFRHNPPNGVILVDYPGFNWWIARLAKRRRIPVFYYVPPQVWAWARWRVHKMRRLTDLVLCTLPFEAQFFRRHGCSVVYIGHPFFDYLSRLRLDYAFVAALKAVAPTWVTLLPGSRMQELDANWSILLDVAQQVATCRPDVHFAVAAFSPEHARWLSARSADTPVKLHIWAGKTQELIHLARCCVAVSGSVALELMYHEKPAAIVYHISPLAWVAQGFFRQVKYICLVNLLASGDPLQPGRRWPGVDDQDGLIYPEYLTYRNPAPAVADRVLRWLNDPVAYRNSVDQLRRLKQQYAQAGAATRAAACIVERIHRTAPPGSREIRWEESHPVPPPPAVSSSCIPTPPASRV